MRSGVGCNFGCNLLAVTCRLKHNSSNTAEIIKLRFIYGDIPSKLRQDSGTIFKTWLHATSAAAKNKEQYIVNFSKLSLNI